VEFPLLIYIPNAPPVDGSDPVTKYAASLVIGKGELIIGVALVPSNFNTSPGTLPSSSTRPKIQLSVVSWRVNWVLILHTGRASNARPSIVHDLRPIQLRHDQTFVPTASKSTVLTR
jgi:hypothetical protein